MLTFNDVLRSPPRDDLLLRIFRPLEELYEDREQLAGFRDSEPSIGSPQPRSNSQLVEEWYPDITPTWWPRSRPDAPWTADERRAVFLAQLLWRLPAGFPPAVWTRSDVQRLLNVLREIAYWVDSYESQVVESP